jgi:hypothetical protein
MLQPHFLLSPTSVEAEKNGVRILYREDLQAILAMALAGTPPREVAQYVVPEPAEAPFALSRVRGAESTCRLSHYHKTRPPASVAVPESPDTLVTCAMRGRITSRSRTLLNV